MNIRKLQRQAAASTDELLAVSEDIGRYVIPAYGNAPGEMFAMQCRVQLERCRRLTEKMRKIEEALSQEAQRMKEAPSPKALRTQEAPPQAAGKSAEAKESGEDALPGFPEGAADFVAAEREKSVALTLRLLAQNLLLAGQKERLLEDLIAHSDSVESRLKDARDMEDRARILELQNTLRRELSPCLNEKENGN